MFNVTVVKMKDILRYILSCIITIILIMILTKIFSKIKQGKKDNNLEKISFGTLIGCLEKTLPSSSIIEKEEDKEKEENKNYLKEILKEEISSIKVIEKVEDNQIQETQQTEERKEKNELEEKKEDNEIVLASTENIKTEVVTPNPIKESFNVQYGKVKIKNQTSYTLTEDILKPNIKIDNKNVVIFQTHSCESYTSSEKYTYTPSGNFRTTDLNYTVTRVGTELETYLKKYNINVTHDTSYHDHPAYNGSYTRSLETVENILKTTASDIIIDVHRDAIGSRDDYAPTVKIGEDYCAQIMFVIRNK